VFSDWHVPLPPEEEDSGGRMNLAALISRIVREEVRAFAERQERRRLTAFLSASEIAEGVERGKVNMGGTPLRQRVDSEDAVGTALQAFEDGLYLVFIDDRQAVRLEDEVNVLADTKVLFVRLVALAGA
jgi:hypothetical protein